MLIQLRQSEIEAALKGYIQNQGINLYGKTVEISFTSGRKDNGISADLDIVENQQSLMAVPTEQTKPCVDSAKVVKDSCPVKDPVEAADGTDFPEDIGEPVTTVETKAATSLFG